MKLPTNRVMLFTLLAALSLAVDIGFARFGFGLMLPAMKAELTGSFWLYGMIATLHLGSYFVGSLLVPLMLQRLSWRAAFVLAHLLVAVGLFAQAFVSSVEQLVAVRMFLGLVTSLGVLSALGAAFELVEASSRMYVSAVIWTGAAMGIMLSAPAGSWILEQVGRWNLVSLWAAAPALIIALLGFSVNFPVNESINIGGAKNHLVEGFRKLKNSSNLLWAYALYGLSYYVFATFALVRVVQVITDTGTAVTWLWVSFGATAAIGSLTLPILMRSRLRVHALTISLAVASLGALASLGAGNSAVVVGALLIGLGLTATPAVASVYIRERVEAMTAPSALAAAIAICSAGSIVGPIVAGLMIDVIGINSMPLLVFLGYTAATVAAALDRRSQR